jgi:CCR4-NOT transcription complex subunit 7/8
MTRSSGCHFTGMASKVHLYNQENEIHFQNFSAAWNVTKIINSENIFFRSGYDFGYLLKVLNNANLPAEEAEFFELLKIFFPRIYDVKYLMKSCKNLKGGLQEVSELLEVSCCSCRHWILFRNPYYRNSMDLPWK